MSLTTKTKMRMNAKATRKGKVHHNLKCRNQLNIPFVDDPEKDEEKIKFYSKLILLFFNVVSVKIKFYFKSKQGQATILFTDQLTYVDCVCLEAYINKFMAKRHVKLNGSFICTGKKRRKKS